MKRSICLAMALVAGIASAATAETEAARLELVVPGRGGISLDHPSSWHCEAAGSPPTLVCDGGTEGSFSVQVTAIAKQPGKLVTDAELETAVRGSGEELLSTAVQKKLELRRVAGAEVTGYVYALTDRSPEKGSGDFREMTQGILSTRSFALSVTILTHSGDAKIVEPALAMVAAAREVTPADPVEGNTGGDAASVHLAIRDTATAYELSVPISRLAMTIPKAGLTRQSEGGSDSPRYFHFLDAGRGLNISGWFESDRGFTDLEKFWAGETAGWKRSGLPAPQNVSFETFGHWQAIVYDLALPGAKGSNTHIRAHWIEAGTWIDIHLSLTSERPLPEVRTGLRGVLDGIRVQQKAP